MTNFTDTVLAKLLRGVLAHERIPSEISLAAYKQYHLLLKDRSSILYQANTDITFVFFDINSYARSSFTEGNGHWREVLSDLKEYCSHTVGPVVVMNFPIPYRGSYGNLFELSPLFTLVNDANAALRELSKETKNLYISDVNALISRIGERHARNLRDLYAFDIPFTNDFFIEVAKEWGGYVRAVLGKTKKCLVVDLDNTLWGGVLGELGPTGVAVGPEYPGFAFLSFQHALLELYERGVILAINSKNNPSDVAEVFKTNPHMALKEEHFASIKTNWNDKAKNLMEIAEELNIGLDSIVFLDDDPVNRDLVRSLVPEVAVPELPAEPEQYVSMLYALNFFNQFSLTDEDWGKAKQYVDERQRKSAQYATRNVEDYIRALQIRIAPEKNALAFIPRISQMTLKTNQFNLTTKRYGEKEIEDLMRTTEVYSGDVSDKFGEYGRTILAIVKDDGKDSAVLDTFLMSCRVMGRGVEYAFVAYVGEELRRAGKKNLEASFIPTAKNEPSREFLTSLGFGVTGTENGTLHYALSLRELIKNARAKQGAISIIRNI